MSEDIAQQMAVKTIFKNLINERNLTLNVTANDSIFLGSGGYEDGSGGKVLNMHTDVWTNTFIPNNIFNTLNITNGRVASMAGKGCEYFYYSDDYGKTYITKPLPQNISYTCWRGMNPSDKAPYLRQIKGNPLFVPNNRSNGLKYSPDLGTTWVDILPDSTVSSIEVYQDDIYVLTNHKTLIKDCCANHYCFTFGNFF